MAVFASGALFAAAGMLQVFAQTVTLEHCHGPERLSVDVSFQEQHDIDVRTGAALTREPNRSRNDVQLLATGPVLGSMDSRDIQFRAACASGQIQVTATVVRSSGYAGAVLKFSTWRPLLRLHLLNTSQWYQLTLVWKMISSDGSEIEHGDLPGGPGETFPITFRSSLR